MKKTVTTLMLFTYLVLPAHFMLHSSCSHDHQQQNSHSCDSSSCSDEQSLSSYDANHACQLCISNLDKTQLFSFTSYSSANKLPKLGTQISHDKPFLTALPLFKKSRAPPCLDYL